MNTNGMITVGGAALARSGYVQVSRKFRLVAKLSHGETGLEALRRVDPGLVRQWEENLERQASEYFLRVHGEHVELSEEAFNDFVKAKVRR